jgi:NAD(P)-dependent dehydrogenase (short-subunit alcohol dehydrogenase family)
VIGEVRHALVTGASSGIGAAIVERLLRDGWRVTGVARRGAAVEHSNFRALPLDLSETASIGPAVAGLVPDAIIHAAGMLRVGEVGMLAASDGEAMWRLHVAAAEQLVNALAPRMPDEGRIVLVGSRTGAGAAGRSQYAGTKAALVAMARSWAAELAPRGLTVNVVAPAATDTPMLRDPARDKVSPRLPPIGRYVRPEEVAAAVAFFLDQDAGAITGQCLTICGGSSLG